MVSPKRLLVVLPVVACLLGGMVQAQFSIAPSRIPSGSPNNSSSSENVDFGDVDLDGDWDVVMADGGDDGNDQNRIWINQGGDQSGSIGFFEDDTSMRFPSVSDDSRDIEFVDFDNDGDLDIYSSNTATISNQGNRWWTNLGGQQMGSVGFYADETTSRWVNLGGSGSSIDPSLVTGGTFIDWSCDCDFGDLDNDGDMDLVHSTYGGDFDGDVPTRIFLNDGDGNFTEFNPSGFKLSGTTIDDFEPGLWCDGDQLSDTENSNGTFCDIATTALDIDVGDIDGDFDLDILHGARNEAPRMFANRLDASSLAPAVGGGALGFRDVTGAVFPSGYYSDNFGHYEQEMGDFDGDGDLDIYGLNWETNGFFFNDNVMKNTGNGTYANPVQLSGSIDDDNEGDFLDYDNDGDLDLYVANFSGQDKLYRNTNGNGNFQLANLPGFSATSLDADACDVDGDGDYDVLVGEDNFAANTFLLNVTGTPDTHAPYIPNIEDLADQLAQPGPFPVRAQVYDNAPYYITWFNPTSVELAVDGVPLPSIPAISSGGQIFRAELPGNLVGTIAYRFVSEDEYGNRGVSERAIFNARGGNVLRGQNPGTAPGGIASHADEYGRGTRGTHGVPELDVLSVAFPDAPFFLVGRYGPDVPFVLRIATAAGDLRVPGLIQSNVAGRTLATFRGRTDEAGNALISIEALPSDLPAGTAFFAQFAVLDGVEDRWAVSRGVRIVSQ